MVGVEARLLVSSHANWTIKGSYEVSRVSELKNMLMKPDQFTLNVRRTLAMPLLLDINLHVPRYMALMVFTLS